jgi:menaquinone-dependent protoporphyrinogen oxidase
MKDKILLAYASICGSTGEVAEAVGQVLNQAGAEVDVCRMKKVKDLDPYRAFVIGTAIRMGKPLPEAVDFAKKYHGVLAQAPVALFSLGVGMCEDTPENRKETMGYLVSLLDQLNAPVSIAMFGGKVDYSKLSWLLRFFASKDKSGALREGDWRNWEALRAWAEVIAPLLGNTA